VTLLELKPLTRDWLGTMLELDYLCFGGLWTLEGYQRELDSPNSNLLGLFGSAHHPSGALGMGCLWAILEEAHITILAVHPHYRRRGFGKVLLLALLMAAVERGLERATLEVRASNSSALSLYREFGFKTAGRRRGYYRDSGEDALILWRSDLQAPEFQKSLDSWQSSIGNRLAADGWEIVWNLSIPKNTFLTKD
jgi:ribosomal-protein-alanine N-acetyltransferase